VDPFWESHHPLKEGARHLPYYTSKSKRSGQERATRGASKTSLVFIVVRLGGIDDGGGVGKGRKKQRQGSQWSTNISEPPEKKFFCPPTPADPLPTGGEGIASGGEKKGRSLEGGGGGGEGKLERGFFKCQWRMVTGEKKTMPDKRKQKGYWQNAGGPP